MENEQSQSSASNQTLVELTPIVMYSLLESSNDDYTPQEDKEFQSASEINGVKPDDVAECELKRCNCFQDMEMMTEEPKLGSEENCEGLGGSLNEDSVNAVMPIREVRPEGVCENATKNVEDLKKFECVHSGSVDNFANWKCELPISAEKKEKMRQGVCQNATKNIDDLEKIEYVNSGSVDHFANGKRKLPILAEKEKMLQGVCKNDAKNIEDLEKFEYVNSGSVDNFANGKCKLPISAEKKEKMPQGVCENDTKNIDDKKKLESARSGSVDNFANGKRKLPITVDVKKEKNIGGNSTNVSSTSSSKDMNFMDFLRAWASTMPESPKRDHGYEGLNFLEIAKKRGMKFPRPSDGIDE